MVFYGVGNHGGGPTRANLASIDALEERGGFGHLRLSSVGGYFDHVRARRADLPVWHGDLQMHAPGCYSANSRIKALNRRAENAVLAAERFAVLSAHLAGTPYPAAELTHAWKQLLFNQFHDILPGSAIEAVFTDAEQQLGEVLSIADRTTALSLQRIARRVEIPAEHETLPVLVFNPHPWTLDTAVEVETVVDGDAAHVVTAAGAPVVTQSIQTAATVHSDRGRRTRQRVLFPVSVPPLGHRLYRVRPGAPEVSGPGVRVGEWQLSNEHVELAIDPGTGWLRSVLDRRSGVDLVAGARGAHTVVRADDSDTWGHRVVSYVGPGSAFVPVSLAVVERGPYRAAIRIESRFGASTLVETVSLTADDPAVRVDARLDWRERSTLLKVRVPTAMDTPTVTYEVPYGHLIRPADSVERPGQSWVDLSGEVDARAAGLTVITTAKYAYDVTDADIGITAARSPVYAFHHPRRLDPGDHYSYQDQGPQAFSYLLVPHAGDWLAAGIPRRAAALLMPPVAALEHFHDGPLPAELANAESEDPRVLITAVKAAEDDPGDVVVRAVELAGRRGPAVVALPVLGRRLDLEFGPYEIRTVRVPADPALPVVEVDMLEYPTAQPRPT